MSVGDLARAPDVAGARCPLTPRPPSVAAFRCPLPPRVEVTLARCRAAAHRRAVYANLARAPAGTGLRPSAGFALPRWRSLVARRADGGLCRVAPCGDHARALPCRRPPTRGTVLILLVENIFLCERKFSQYYAHGVITGTKMHLAILRSAAVKTTEMQVLGAVIAVRGRPTPPTRDPSCFSPVHLLRRQWPPSVCAGAALWAERSGGRRPGGGAVL